MVDRTAITEMELLQIIVEMLKEEMKDILIRKKHKNILRGGSVATVPFASADFCVVLFQNC